MTDPYRAMCAELAQEVEHLWSIVRDDNNESHSLAVCARALLAQPVAEGPTDEEIMELMPLQMRDDLAAAASALACGLAITGFEVDSLKAAGICRIILNRHAVDHARAVLAKYGTLMPEATVHD